MTRPVFVIPHYSATESSWRFLDRAVSGILEQTDPDWDAIIIDDCSPSSDKTARLRELRARDSERLRVIEKNTNTGLVCDSRR
jgi:glycosyltransferase involved in cell wall biosynthesis